jgi:glucose uptake protein GlcU
VLKQSPYVEKSRYLAYATLFFVVFQDNTKEKTDICGTISVLLQLQGITLTADLHAANRPVTLRRSFIRLNALRHRARQSGGRHLCRAV